MFHNAHDGGDQRVRDWLVQRPKLTLWVVIATCAIIIVLMLANTHHAGVQMLTPGKHAPVLGVATIEGLIQAPLFLAQASAASRQADARG